MAYQNTYAVAVPKKIAQEYGLKTISDLKKVEGQLKAGFTLEFTDREDGNKGLQKVYGLIYKSQRWSQLFATRRSSLVISR